MMTADANSRHNKRKEFCIIKILHFISL
jgi:hypothetical protein